MDVGTVDPVPTSLSRDVVFRFFRATNHGSRGDSVCHIRLRLVYCLSCRKRIKRRRLMRKALPPLILNAILLIWIAVPAVAGAAKADAVAPATTVSLSDAEREWLAAHPIVRLGIDAGYAPYSFLDSKGRLQGVVADFLSRIEGLLGIRFEITGNLSWLALMDAVHNKHLDAVATVTHLPERDAFLAFSGPYLLTPLVVMTRNKAPQLTALKDLAELELVLVEGYSGSKRLVAQYPQLRPRYVTNPLAGLGAVSSGAADAYVGVLGVNTYLAIQHGFANLKVNAAFDMETQSQSFGVRKDWPQLAQLIDKALAAIAAKEKEAILQKWLPVLAKDVHLLGEPGLVMRLIPWLLVFAGLAIIGYLTLLLRNRQRLRKQAEVALLESEQRYRTLFEHMTAGFVLFEAVQDDAGRPVDLLILAANKGFEITTRLSAADFMGKRLTQVLPGIERDAADWIGTYGQIALGGESRQFEQQSELLGYCYSVTAFQAGPGQCAVTFTDITERKRAETELANERGLLKTLIQNLPDLVWLKDPDGTYLACNPRFEDFVGSDETGILGKTDYDLFAPELAEFFRNNDRKAMLAGKPTMNEEEVTFASDGHRELLQTIKTPMVAADGKFLGVLGVARDITADRQNQESIRQLSLAVEQSPESIIITNTDAEIEYVNEAFLRVTGYERNEVLGQNPRILHSGKTPAENYADLWATLVDGRSWKGEFINQRKDGSEYTEFAIVTPIRQADGRISHFVAVKEDITEKKRVGEELDRYRHHLEDMVSQRTAELEQARAAAEAANLAKSTFLANMSHEIRTPMNAIVGLSHLLRRDSATPLQTERLNKIDTATQHLLSIISNILDLSKIEAAKLQLEHKDFALGAVLDHTHSMISDAAHAKGLSVQVDSDAVPPWLRGDSIRLRQALLNYAANAVKFTEHGTITLRAKMLEEVGQRLLVRFEVEDTGIGIAPDVIPQLFQAFEQADASTTRKHGGTGLGLAITRHLAELMGGEAGVESKPGQGTRFWFTAWLERGHGVVVEAARPSSDAETQLRQRHAGARLLLVDDNPINREVVLELLHAVGLAVDTAEDGRVALEKAKTGDYDLILMDVQMPVMSGLEATRAIRALSSWSDIPILAMTANVFTEDRDACLDAGMRDFVPKPVEPNDFYATLLAWLPERPGQTAPVPGGDLMPSQSANAVTLEKLLNQPELDVARSLAILRGDQDKYLNLLHRFVAEHQDDMAHLAECTERQDWQVARQIAHALHGAAANLGAKAVAKAAAGLDALLASETDQIDEVDLLARIGEIAKALEQLAQMVGRSAPAPEAPVTPAVDAQAQAALAELARLLATNDIRAQDYSQENAALFAAALDRHYPPLARLIEAFDFERALEVLNSIGNRKED